MADIALPVTCETTLDNDAPQQYDDWEDCKSQAATLIEYDNKNWWAKGELALRVERRYKEKGLAAFCAETKLGATKTMYEHALLCAFFPPSARAQVPSLLKEHFRQAYRIVNQSPKPIQDKLGAAMGYLKQAEDAENGGWSAARMAHEMKLKFGQESKERWRVQPTEIRLTDEGAVLVLSKEERERLAKALIHQGKDRFEAALSLSFVHPPEEKS